MPTVKTHQLQLGGMASVSGYLLKAVRDAGLGVFLFTMQ